jgi:predicted ABC-type ATPase
MPSSDEFKELAGALMDSVPRDKPTAIVLAGHNGSGKSTLWYDKLADSIQYPLVNADRLTLSLLPELEDKKLKPWATRLRDEDENWQRLSQESVQLLMGLIRARKMSFDYETVFSHLVKQTNGPPTSSKIDAIKTLQREGYFVVLMFVGLANAELSIARVATRKSMGGHDVPEEKLRSRFKRTQQAVKIASFIADATLMFDNSRTLEEAFAPVRWQYKETVLFDCRNGEAEKNSELVLAASPWLTEVAPL